jgi:hypothetical protein
MNSMAIYFVQNEKNSAGLSLWAEQSCIKTTEESILAEIIVQCLQMHAKQSDILQCVARC